ncbi:hypothetical protein PI125_g13147 [Phytophthora idaei]|nr:hypothetical protein PI125_g13147 [Phytophthora idaei]
MLQLKRTDNVKRKCSDAQHETKKVKATQVKAVTTYAVRKERKRLLMEQAEDMQDKLDKLKFRLLVKQGQIEKDTKRTVAENAVLHEYIQEQLITLRYNTSSTDRTRAAKSRGPTAGSEQRYLVARTQNFESGVKYCQEERLETIDGDNCIIRFETGPICGANVKAVFDALLGTVLNSEMFLSQLFGSTTIREDSDFENSELAQVRLVSLTSSRATVESNTVVFSKLGAGANGEYGIMAEDFVDFDELHPYRSSERVRRDTTTIVMVRALPQTNGASPVAVVTRWTCLKIHNSTAEVSQRPETELMESSVYWSDTAQKCIEEQLMNAATPNPPQPF